jgi:hypothetical protein
MRDREPRIVTSADDDPWQSAQQERALATIWPLLGRHIAFHRRLVDLTANVKAALLLSQSIYWTRHGRDIAQTGGWFLKTTEQWQMETGLSAKEQAAAREVLRELAILNEQRVGIPARLHFRLCVDQLGALLSDRHRQALGASGLGRWRRRRGTAGPVARLSPHGWPASAAGSMPACCCHARCT